METDTLPSEVGHLLDEAAGALSQAGVPNVAAKRKLAKAFPIAGSRTDSSPAVAAKNSGWAWLSPCELSRTAELFRGSIRSIE